jgi:uncharacterized membrane protein
MLVHFPIALLIIGFLSEMAGLFKKKEFFSRSAFYLLILGTLGTIASYLAGKAAGEGMEDGPLEKAMEQHEQAGTIALWLTVATASIYHVLFIFKYKKVWARVASIILFATVIAAISRTGYLGGQLVYKHGAGVQLALPDFSNPSPDAE